MNRKTLIGIIAAAGVTLFATVAYMTLQRPETPSSTTGTQINETDSTTPPQKTSNEPVSTAAIIYTSDGFRPNTLTVKKGSQITVTNNSSMNVMLSSADHPTHEEQPELNMEMLQPNESGTITLTKVGTWGYHDHIDESMTGSIIVTE